MSARRAREVLLGLRGASVELRWVDAAVVHDERFARTVTIPHRRGHFVLQYRALLSSSLKMGSTWSEWVDVPLAPTALRGLV